MPVSTENAMDIIGVIAPQMKMMKNIRINTPHWFRKSSMNLYCGGMSENRILDPSRGGIGIRLKSASTRFMKTIMEVIA